MTWDTGLWAGTTLQRTFLPGALPGPCLSHHHPLSPGQTPGEELGAGEKHVPSEADSGGAKNKPTWKLFPLF